MNMTLTDLVRRYVPRGAVWGMVVASMAGCGAPRTGPVEIFPEDACATCRMAFSDHRFASEIIDGDGGVFKFDDIACMETFRSGHGEVRVVATFVKDYGTNAWIAHEHAVIVTTGVASPMGSGKLAFADSSRALAFQKEHPVLTTAVAEERPGCCADMND